MEDGLEIEVFVGLKNYKGRIQNEMERVGHGKRERERTKGVGGV